MTLNVPVEDGKYTVIQGEDGHLRILRYGEPWLGEDDSIAGGKAIISMACELEELRDEVKSLKDHFLGKGWEQDTSNVLPAEVVEMMDAPVIGEPERASPKAIASLDSRVGYDAAIATTSRDLGIPEDQLRAGRDMAPLTPEQKAD